MAAPARIRHAARVTKRVNFDRILSPPEGSFGWRTIAQNNFFAPEISTLEIQPRAPAGQPLRRANRRLAFPCSMALTVSAGSPERARSPAGSPADRNGKSLPNRTCEPGTTLSSALSDVELLALAVS